MKTNRSPSMPPAPRSTPSSPTVSTQTLQRSPSAPELGGAPKSPSTPKSPGDNSSFSTQAKASGSHVPQNTGATPRSPSAPPSPTSSPQSPKTVSSSLDAEMARNKAQLGGTQSRNGGPAPSPHHEQISSGMQQRISQSKPGTMNPQQYSPQEMKELTSHAHSLGISPKDTEALLFAGSRKEKPINAAEMKQQMDNHVNVVKQQGHPYRFENKQQYQDFSNSLIGKLKQQGFPTDQVMIQGSALRKPTAGDVDISVLANKQQFSQALSNSFSPPNSTTNKVKANGQGIDLRGMSYEDMQKLSADIKQDKQMSQADPNYKRKYNSNSDTFQNAFDSGKLASKGSQNPAMKPVAQEMKDKFPNANVESVSLVLQGSAFDTPPNMQVKPS